MKRILKMLFGFVGFDLGCGVVVAIIQSGPPTPIRVMLVAAAFVGLIASGVFGLVASFEDL